MNRRQLLKATAAASAGALAAPFISRGRFLLFAGSTQTYSTRCIDLVHRSLVIDMLSQFKLGAFPDVLPDHNQPTAKWWSHPETFTTADLERYRESGINVFHIGWGTGRVQPYDDARKVLSAWDGFIDHFNHNFTRVTRADDFIRLKRDSKIGIILGFQGADHFRKTEDIAEFYALGQRVSQLTYNMRNAIGSGYVDIDTGLTHFGVDVVAAMNRAGMAIDLSHCGPRTTADTCRLSARPVLITHANCRALNPHPRNKTDEAIRKMAATGGVMGITGVRQFVRATEPVTIENVLDHFDHVARLVGVEHVGVGSDIDLDGYDKLPPALKRKMLTGYKNDQDFRGDVDGLNHPKRMFDLTEGLIRRKYSDSDIAKVLGGNFARALGQIWV
jgi:membrane dipeptidase